MAGDSEGTGGSGGGTGSSGGSGGTGGGGGSEGRGGYDDSSGGPPPSSGGSADSSGGTGGSGGYSSADGTGGSGGYEGGSGHDASSAGGTPASSGQDSSSGGASHSSAGGTEGGGGSGGYGGGTGSGGHEGAGGTTAGGGVSSSQEGVGSFFEGAIVGDFADENQTWSKVAGQVVVGFIPFAGQVADARDTLAAIDGVWDGKDGAWGNLVLAGIAWVPGFGDMVKGGFRIGRKGAKALKAGEEIAAQGLKHADDAAHAAKGGEKGFAGMLRGELVHLPGVQTRTIEYVKRSSTELADLRSAFNKEARAAFLKDLANDPAKVAKLREAGLDDVAIKRMQDGKVPTGFQVHHKIPIDDGGTNAFDNLVLMQNEPYHKVITNAQNALIEGMKEGEKKVIDFPVPEGFVYPPVPIAAQ
jgi:hypothetical protein